MPDTPFRTPEEFASEAERLAFRERFIDVVAAIWTCNDGPEGRQENREEFDAVFPPLPCPPERPAPDRAEVEAAVDDFEYKIRCETMDTERGMHGRFAVTPGQVDAARTRLLALYAEPVGEEYEVAAMSDGCVSMPVVLLTGPQFDIGDWVRVSKVEGV